MSLVSESKKERYSFSKLSSFHNCKYGYYLTYIEHHKGITNCFASYGLFVHSIMERYAKGELSLWDLPKIYKEEFTTAVPEEFPDAFFCHDMRQLYYDQGLQFLQDFAGYEDIKILDTETQFDLDIDDWTFNGIIDLVFRDERGRLIIRDYKSKSTFKSKKEKAEYARQLYLYSLYVKQRYGRYPDELQFMLFRKNNVVKIPFQEEGVEDALKWARDTVKEIRDCWDFAPTCEAFFSRNLCNHREYCDCKLETDL